MRIVGPVWQYLDPFSTLHDAGAWVLRTVGVDGWTPADYPAALGRWPAVVGFVFFVWLELVYLAGPSVLFVVLVGYTALTLAMMAQFGRDEWRSQGEIFTVWFRLLGRLAPLGARRRGRPGPAPVVRRAACSRPGGRAADVDASSPSACGSIIFDGLSQTAGLLRPLRRPGVCSRRRSTPRRLPRRSSSALAIRGRARPSASDAIGAGLLPIAAGYLIAHYLTYLLIDGQRIIIAISDPLQRGWDLFGTAFYEPTGRLAATGSRVDRAAGGGRRRPHARRVGRPRVAALDAPPGTVAPGAADAARSRWRS